MPYAEPPVGDLRFAAPVLKQPWKDVLDCTVPNEKMCVQISSKSVIGQEDCLYLNIYRPKNVQGKVPVMIFLYGGSFMYGSNSFSVFGPEYLMDYDLCLVIPNYRIGRFGFLSMEDEVIPGNYGFKDQNMVLQWVNKYISDFGGDPNQVCLCGQSVGGFAVGLHMMANQSKDLFQRGISLSGSPLAFSSLSHPGQIRERTIDFAFDNGCPPNNSTDMLKCFKNLMINSFVMTAEEEIWNFWLDTPLAKGNVRESPNATNAFMTFNPYEEMPNISPNMSWLVTLNSCENARFCDPLYKMKIYKYIYKALNRDYRETWPQTLGYLYTCPDDTLDIDDVSDKIRETYVGDPTSMVTYLTCIAIATDREYIMPARQEIELFPGKMYFLFSEYSPTVSNYEHPYKRLGPVHSDEQCLIFDKFCSKIPLNGTDLILSEKFCSWIANFVIYGDPNGSNGPVEWKPVQSKQDGEYLRIFSNISYCMDTQLRQPYYQMWRDLKLKQDF